MCEEMCITPGEDDDTSQAMDSDIKEIARMLTELNELAYNTYKPGYSVQNEHSFRKFRAPFSGKAEHTFPEQSAVNDQYSDGISIPCDVSNS